MSRLLVTASLALAAFTALIISAMNAGAVQIELALARSAVPLGLIAGLFWHGYWVAELLNERGRLRLAESQARANAATGGDAD